MQVNVRKVGQTNNHALLFGYKRDIDIIVVEKPWIECKLNKKMCKKHKEYQVFASEDKWEKKPRVITYVQKKTLAQQTKKHQYILGTNGCSNILLLEL